MYKKKRETNIHTNKQTNGPKKKHTNNSINNSGASTGITKILFGESRNKFALRDGNDKKKDIAPSEIRGKTQLAK